MPPRVTYWTGTWDPGREANSKEIEALRAMHPRRSPVVAISAGQRSSLRPRDGVIRLSIHRWILFRLLAMTVERLGDVTHIFGSPQDWHMLRALGRRPTLFTVTIPGPLFEKELYARIDLFAAESEELADALRASGIPGERIRVIHPDVDPERFPLLPQPPHEPFRLFFASSPANAGEFESRGIPLLVEVARRRPGVEILCFWRTWDDAAEAQAALDALDPPANFKVIRGDLADMTEAYRRVHASILAFAGGFGKSCPNSIVEALSCGRPAILADTCGIARLVEETGAGIRVPREADALAKAVDRLRAGHADYAERARAAAERHFALDAFRSAYAGLYEELAASRA